MSAVSSECVCMATGHDDADFDFDEADGDPPYATQQGTWPDEPSPEEDDEELSEEEDHEHTHVR